MNSTDIPALVAMFHADYAAALAWADEIDANWDKPSNTKDTDNE